MRTRVGDQPRRGRAPQSAEQHPERVAGVDAAEHRGARTPLQLRALRVERHVDDAVAAANAARARANAASPGARPTSTSPAV
jgi:hypothetical protein